MSKIYDIVSFNGEYDLFRLRYEMLKDTVDEFIIVESRKTFSGEDKPIYTLQSDRYFYDRMDKWDKVRLFIDEGDYSDEEIQRAVASRYTMGEERWIREYLQKESLSKALVHLNDDDIVYLGDVDELWEHREPNGIEKLKLRVYAYWLNFRSTEQFWGTIRCQYRDIRDKCLNDIRNDISYRTEDYQGWHFTNQGGYEAVRKKIEDQYNAELFNDHLIKDLLPRNFGERDFIGRDFKLEMDESELPAYLLENKQQFTHLWKSSEPKS